MPNRKPSENEAKPGEDEAVEKEPMFRTGKAAEMIGHPMTGRRLTAMINAGDIPGIRTAEGKWAWIPLSVIEALRQQMRDQLHRPMKTDPENG